MNTSQAPPSIFDYVSKFSATIKPHIRLVNCFDFSCSSADQCSDEFLKNHDVLDVGISSDWSSITIIYEEIKNVPTSSSSV